MITFFAATTIRISSGHPQNRRRRCRSRRRRRCRRLIFCKLFLRFTFGQKVQKFDGRFGRDDSRWSNVVSFRVKVWTSKVWIWIPEVLNLTLKTIIVEACLIVLHHSEESKLKNVFWYQFFISYVLIIFLFILIFKYNLIAKNVKVFHSVYIKVNLITYTNSEKTRLFFPKITKDNK